MSNAHRPLWGFVRRNKRLTAVAAATMVLASLLNGFSIMAVLPVVEYMLDGDLSGSRLPGVFRDLLASLTPLAFVAGLVLLFVFKAVVQLYLPAVQVMLAGRLQVQWTDIIYGRVLSNRFESMAAIPPGNLVTAMKDEVLQSSKLLTAWMQFSVAMMNFLVLVALMVVTDWRGIFAFALLGGIGAAMNHWLLEPTTRRIATRRRETNRAVSGLLVELAHSLKEYRILGLGTQRRRQTRDHLRDFVHCQKLLKTMHAVPLAVGELLVILLIAAFLLAVQAGLVANSEALVPLVAFYIISLLRSLSFLQEAARKRIEIVDCIPGLERTLEFMQQVQEGERPEAGGRGVPPEPGQELRLDHVSFAYENGHQVLADVSLAFPPAQMVYLLGPSGAGKSTILDLLVGLYPPKAGAVTYGGVDIRDLEIAAWRRRISYVSQESTIFRGTIEENMRLLVPDLPHESLEHLAEISGLDTVVAAAPNGWDTDVGNDGGGLSGGQRKRLAIARALTLRPDILVLDEATTAFEETLEKEILARVRAEHPAMILIVITHRISSARDADLIHVLAGGKLVVSGDYPAVAPIAQPLLRKGGADDDGEAGTVDEADRDTNTDPGTKAAPAPSSLFRR